MPDALRLSLFLLVILMVAIAVAVFAKLIGVLIAAPRQDSVPQIIRRQERLATIRAALDLEHQRLAVWATVLLIKQDRAKWPAGRPRSEEHRGGKGWVSTGRSRGSPDT